MSSEFTVRRGGPPPRATIDPGIEELRWTGDLPPDPLEPGVWELYLEGVSTRVTTVACEPRAPTVTIRSGASFEDCELALGIARRTAALGEGKVGERVMPELEEGGDSFMLAMLLPGGPCVLPRTDRLALAAGEEAFLISRPALAELPVRSTWLDDGNQLVVFGWAAHPGTLGR